MSKQFYISILLVSLVTLWPCKAGIVTPVKLVHTTNSQSTESLNFCKHCVCGVGRAGRIVNGEMTSFDEFPWAAQLNYDGEMHGGGSLITARHVLTAGHVLDGFDSERFTVHLADNVTYRIKHFTIHPEYKPVSQNNDIGIIELRRPVKLGTAVRTICLPNYSTFNYDGKMGVAIGWGKLGFEEPLSEGLRKVNLPIISKKQCQKSGYAKERVTENMFCAGYFDGTHDTCKGDSGGPLQVRSDSGAMEVIGIVSFGRRCAEPNFPGVYTKVTNYLGWIAKNLNNECLCSPPTNA